MHRFPPQHTKMLCSASATSQQVSSACGGYIRQASVSRKSKEWTRGDMGEPRRGKTLALENYQQPKKSDLSDLALAIEEPLESTLQEEGVEGQ